MLTLRIPGLRGIQNRDYDNKGVSNCATIDVGLNFRNFLEKFRALKVVELAYERVPSKPSLFLAYPVSQALIETRKTSCFSNYRETMSIRSLKLAVEYFTHSVP